jgi:outer membrane protein assembly factor BamE (lipoprotein component of BamABCDE complex)
MANAAGVMRTGSTGTSRKNGRKGLGLAGALACALALGGCIGFDGTHHRGYVIDVKAQEQVRVGASAEQVLVVMGTPSTTSTVGGDAWYYISQKTERAAAFMQPKVTDQRVFAVYFDRSKRVQRVANYGIEDGRLIDFVTRTTPTAGPEASFLRNMFTGLLRFD